MALMALAADVGTVRAGELSVNPILLQMSAPAMAGALSIRLGGPATYDGVLHERPVFGTGPAPGVTDLGRGLRTYVIACALLWLLLGALLIVTIMGLSR